MVTRPDRQCAAASSRLADRSVAIALAATLGASIAILWGINQARAGGSADEQRACTPDVFRLCASEIPSEDRIVVCLNKKITQLSPACRRVMDSDDTPKRQSRR